MSKTNGDMGPFKDMDPKLVEAISRYGTLPYRQMVTVSIERVGSYSFDKLPNTIAGWIEWLTEAGTKCPAEYEDSLRCDLEYESGSYDSGDSASLSIYYQRPETDEEMRTRVGRGIAYVVGQAAQERATYEALKKKFG